MVLVILARSSPVVSFGPMAKLESPSMICLSSVCVTNCFWNLGFRLAQVSCASVQSSMSAVAKSQSLANPLNVLATFAYVVVSFQLLDLAKSSIFLMKTIAVTVFLAFWPQKSGIFDWSTLKARVVWAPAGTFAPLGLLGPG
jgi:hypothetical protein